MLHAPHPASNCQKLFKTFRGINVQVTIKIEYESTTFNRVEIYSVRMYVCTLGVVAYRQEWNNYSLERAKAVFEKFDIKSVCVVFTNWLRYYNLAINSAIVEPQEMSALLLQYPVKRHVHSYFPRSNRLETPHEIKQAVFSNFILKHRKF